MNENTTGKYLRQRVEVVKKSPDSHTGHSQTESEPGRHMIQPLELHRSHCDTKYPELNMKADSVAVRPRMVNFHHSFY